MGKSNSKMKILQGGLKIVTKEAFRAIKHLKLWSGLLREALEHLSLKTIKKVSLVWWAAALFLLNVWEENRLLLRELCQPQPESGGRAPCLSCLHSGVQKKNWVVSFVLGKYNTLGAPVFWRGFVLYVPPKEETHLSEKPWREGRERLKSDAKTLSNKPGTLNPSWASEPPGELCQSETAAHLQRCDSVWEGPDNYCCYCYLKVL